LEDSLFFDHIAVGAVSLDQGIRDLRRRFKVKIPFGGTHPRMGTHNCLTRLGDDSFLEIIAVDPEAPPPERPRLFDLDDPGQRHLLSKRPRPIAWIARTRNMDAVMNRAQTVGIDLGLPITMTRGDLRWRLAVGNDGRLPEGGTLPVIIQWPDGPHPAGWMADLGLKLAALRLIHPNPEALRDKLEAIGAAHLATIEMSETNQPRIECDLIAPDGHIYLL